MNRFDCNACFGHWPYWDLPHKTPDDLVALMDGAGIDRAACMSLRGMFLDYRDGNEETLAAARSHPDRLVPMATLAPFPPDPEGPAAALQKVLDGGARGVRLTPLFHSYRLDSGFVDAVCVAAAERTVPIIVPTRPMMNWRFQTVPVDAIGDMVQRHPTTRFVVSGANYLVEFQAVVRLMERCANAVCEISCFQAFGAVRQLVDLVGAERVLFGTGAVLNYPACNVAKLDHAGLDETERAAVAYENARRLFGLDA